MKKLSAITVAPVLSLLLSMNVCAQDLNDDGNIDVHDVDYMCCVGDLTVGVPVCEGDPLDVNPVGPNFEINESDLILYLFFNGTKQGDANYDGAVDGLDFIIWNAHKFTKDRFFSHGDFNGDGNIDGQDFIIWNKNKDL